MGGFIKGLVVGTVSFVLGFAVLSVIIPVEPETPDQAPSIAVQPRDAGGQMPDVSPSNLVSSEPVTPEVRMARIMPTAAQTPPLPPVPQTVVPEAVTPETAAAEAVVPETVAAEQAVEPVAAPAAPVVADPQRSGVVSVDVVSAADGGPDTPAPDTPTPDTPTPDTPTPDTPTPDTPTPDTPTPDTPAGTAMVAPVTEGARSDQSPAADAIPEAVTSDATVAIDPVVSVIPTTPDDPVPAPDAAPEGAEVVASPDIMPTAPQSTAPQSTAPQSTAPEPTPAQIVPSLGVDAAQLDPALEREDDEAGPQTVAPSQPLPRVQVMPSGVPNVAVRRGGATPPADLTTPEAPPEPANPVLNRVVEGVTVGRLPRVGAPAATEQAATGGLDAPPPVSERFAAELNIAPDARLLGIALIDAPEAEAALIALPFQATIAMDPYDPDGPRRAAAYRGAGHEIAVQAAGVPPLANASDIAQVLQVWMQAYPETVAIMDVPFNGIGSRRALARDMTAMLAPDGFGVIALRSGLDAFYQSARDLNLATASVYRALDDGAQSLVTIRRLIDRAAFEAQRSDGILMTGSAGNPETLAALTEFVEGAGRRGVELVPASAILGRD